MTWVIIFIAFTGLVWGFEWFAKSAYWVTSGGEKLTVYEETYPVTGFVIWWGRRSKAPKVGGKQRVATPAAS